ncbi:MAG: hypothetical protein OXF77_03065 [Thaumarchaeota archaeon]|nr:hypothetical protein [Nitrososphaerota archaeon]
MQKTVMTPMNRDWIYICFDDLVDIKKSNENYDIMLSNGLKPMPVYRKWDTLKTLDRWLDSDVRVIGIGSTVGDRKKIRFFRTLKKRYGSQVKRFHLLGVGQEHILREIKPQSSDSSTYTSPAVSYFRYRKFKKENKLQDILNNKINKMSVESRLLFAKFFSYFSKGGYRKAPLFVKRHVIYSMLEGLSISCSLQEDNICNKYLVATMTNKQVAISRMVSFYSEFVERDLRV